MHVARTISRDLSLFRQGLSLLHEVGPHGLGEMVRMAEFLERSIYQEGSFRTTPEGFLFHLLNPPMRMGAFSWASLTLDGQPLASENCFVAEPSTSAPRSLSTLSRQAPLDLRPGQTTPFSARHVGLVPGRHHTVQLNLRNVAIPPTVWIRFTDELRGPKE